jgi:hypothetical protein
MGQSGELTFYTARRLDPPAEFLRRIIQLAAPECTPTVARSRGEDTEWEHFLRDEEVQTDIIAATPENLPQFYREGLSLWASLDSSPLARRVAESIAGEISESIRGSFIPNDLNVTIGYHDLCDFAEHEDGFRIARPFLSLKFFSYGTPFHWQAFRAAVFEIPEVQVVRREFESVVGPLEQCVFWSV